MDASLETLLKRMGKNSQRPNLTSKNNLREEINEVLKQRNKLYRKFSDEIIDTDHLNPQEVTDRIISGMEVSL